MAGDAILATIRIYLDAVRAEGIPVERAILYGSQAKGTADEWSDIDLLVVSPVFDQSESNEAIDALWRARVATRGRIEPVGWGPRQWLEDDGSPLLAIVREEGVEVYGPGELTRP